MKTISLIFAFAVLLLVSHSVVEAADTIPPTIGSVTAGACSIGIAFTDNEALNLQVSTVVVRDGGTGEDITSKFTRTEEGDGTTAGSITLNPLAMQYSRHLYHRDLCI